MLVTPLKKFFASYLRKMRRWEKKHPVLNALIVLIAIVLLWRGVWGLLDAYFFPNNPLLSYGVGSLVGILMLLLDDFELNEV